MTAIHRVARFLTRFVAAGGGVVLLTVGLSACSSDSSSNTLSFCTDPTYPPAEFYQVSKVGSVSLKRELAGADIDIGSAVAHRIGKDARFVTTKFSDIIDHLLNKKCDAIISLMNDTSQRRNKVSFVDYLAAGQDLMFKKGTTPIRSLTDLYGRTVSVASDTTEEDFLKAANKAAPGGKQINIKSYPSENNAILALDSGKVEAYFGDAPIVQSAVAADSSLVRGPELVKPLPIGIALRPGDSRIAAVRKAVHGMYSDGTMGRILSKWKFTSYAIAP
jgi:polar amino acid transport system substrate-binding protein